MYVQYFIGPFRYSDPVIRCRFAEKLSEKYFKLIQEKKDEEERKAAEAQAPDEFDLLK